MRPAPVIGIAGQPGSGKTTLTRFLQRRLSVPAVHYDDYETITAERTAKVRDWIARGSPYDEIELEPLHAEIERLRAERPPFRFVLFDTLLGRAHKRTGDAIDFLIWIDTPPDLALARKLAAASAKAARKPEEAGAFVGWLGAYLDHYQSFIAGTYALQRERVRPRADVVIDGRDPPEVVGEKALAAILARVDEARALHRETVQPQFALSEPGRHLLRMIEGLDCAFGLERSFKLGPDGINRNRLIASLHKSAFGAEPAGPIRRFAEELRMPLFLLDRFMGQLDETEFVHFGFEGPDTVKIYFERSMQAPLLPEDRNRRLVHLAAKWNPDDPARAAVSRYYIPAGATGAERVGAHLDALSSDLAPSATLARDMLALAATRCAGDALFFMEVEDEQTPRRSFDLNIYPADLRVAALEEPLRRLLARYRLDPATVDPLLAEIGRSALGHLSGGVDRHGRDFATVYYGIEPRKGVNRG
ncbi:MAG: hypothetical protein INR68_00460 [Methylobacterium mesophilicum]|nr:hypothetical protein [Methylobacterium mesophilicum]